MRIKKRVAALVLLACNCYAQNNSQVNIGANAFSAKLSLGELRGHAKETVYVADSNYKISQLDWKVNHAPIIKGEFSWDALSWLTLNARGWTTLSSSSGHMQDRDWMTAGQSKPSDISTHPNTPLNYANEFDINVQAWLLKGANYQLGPVVGYQQTRFSWTAFGGTFNYENGDKIGYFPAGKAVIGYRQQFSTPYLGLTGRYRFHDFEISALLKASYWAQAKDNDEHYLRNTTFREKGTSRYYATEVELAYYLTEQAKVFTALSYNRYAEAKASSEMIEHGRGTAQKFPGDSAGIANTHYSAAIGLQYTF